MEDLLKDILGELREIKSTLQDKAIDTCGSKDALKLMGLKNPGYLKFYFDEKQLNRREQGSNTYIYYKSECIALAAGIKSGSVTVLPVKEMLAINKKR